VSEQDRERAQVEGYTVVDLSSVISTHLTEIIRSHAHELLGREEVQHLLDQFGKKSPKLIEELIPHLLTVGGVTRVLGNLLKERLPIRDLRTILETLADHAGNQKDTDTLTEQVRQALSRTITHQYQNGSRQLTVIGIDPKLDLKIVSGIQQTPHGTYLAIEPALAQMIVGKVNQAVERVALKNEQPLLLCSPAARPHLRKLMERSMASVPVLSTAEITPQVRIVVTENIKGPNEN